MCEKGLCARVLRQWCLRGASGRVKLANAAAHTVDVLTAFGNQPNSAEVQSGHLGFKHTTPGATKCPFFCSWQAKKEHKLLSFGGLEKASETHQSFKVVKLHSAQLLQGPSFAISLDSHFKKARQQFGSKIEFVFCSKLLDFQPKNAQAKATAEGRVQSAAHGHMFTCCWVFVRCCDGHRHGQVLLKRKNEAERAPGFFKAAMLLFLWSCCVMVDILKT